MSRAEVAGRETSDRRQQPLITNRRQQGPVSSEGTPKSRVTTPRTELTDTSRGGAPQDRLTSTTPTPTRDFLTSPAAQPVQLTTPATIPNTAVVGGPSAPQFIPDDPRYDHRSSLTAALSNQLPSNVDRSLVIGSDRNIVPNVIEGAVVIGGEDSISASEGEGRTPYEWRVSGLTECTLTCGGGRLFAY